MRLAATICVAILLLLSGAKSAYAQHPAMYSQYMFNTLAINPAYTGSRDALSASFLFRSQWVGFRGAPQTQTFSLHSPLKDSRNNLGMVIVNDKLGVSYTTGFFGTYAFRIPFNDNFRLSFGLQGGLTMHQDRWSQLAVTDGNDNVFTADSPVYLIPRAGAGVYLDGKRWQVGFSTPQILMYETNSVRTYNANSISYKHYFLSGGYAFKLNPDLVLRPSVLLKYMNASPLQMDFNTALIIKDLVWVGLSYRTGDALVAMLEYQINPQFRIGYAFDQAITELRRFNSGSHEFFIRYEFKYGLRVQSPRYF